MRRLPVGFLFRCLALLYQRLAADALPSANVLMFWGRCDIARMRTLSFGTIANTSSVALRIRRRESSAGV